MAVASLALILLLAVIVWRFGGTGLGRQPLRQIVSGEHNNIFELRFWMAVIEGNRFESGVDRIALRNQKDRAEPICAVSLPSPAPHK